MASSMVDRSSYVRYALPDLANDAPPKDCFFVCSAVPYTVGSLVSSGSSSHFTKLSGTAIPERGVSELEVPFEYQPALKTLAEDIPSHRFRVSESLRLAHGLGIPLNFYGSHITKPTDDYTLKFHDVSFDDQHLGEILSFAHRAFTYDSSVSSYDPGTFLMLLPQDLRQRLHSED